MTNSSSPAVHPANRFVRRRARTHHDLLEAAKQLFASKGYHQTKISDIAAAADLGVGTFYLHYESKEALFLELVADTTRELKARVDTAKAAVTDPLDQARRSCEEIFGFARDNRQTFRILFGEGNFNEAIREAQAVFVADVADNLATGIREGVFAPYPPTVIAQGLIGLLTQIVSWWITQDDVSLDEVVSTTNRFITSGLLPRDSTTTGRS